MQIYLTIYVVSIICQHILYEERVIFSSGRLKAADDDMESKTNLSINKSLTSRVFTDVNQETLVFSKTSMNANMFKCKT